MTLYTMFNLVFIPTWEHFLLQHEANPNKNVLIMKRTETMWENSKSYPTKHYIQHAVLKKV